MSAVFVGDTKQWRKPENHPVEESDTNVVGEASADHSSSVRPGADSTVHVLSRSGHVAFPVFGPRHFSVGAGRVSLLGR